MKKDKKMKKNEKAPKTIPKIWLRNGEYQNSWNYPFHLFFSAPGIHHSALKKKGWNGSLRRQKSVMEIPILSYIPAAWTRFLPPRISEWDGGAWLGPTPVPLGNPGVKEPESRPVYTIEWRLTRVF